MQSRKRHTPPAALTPPVRIAPQTPVAQSEVSSAEEEDVKRTRKRRQPIQVQYLQDNPPPPAPVDSIADGAIQWLGIDPNLQPHLHTITDLVNKHVHLNVQDPHQASCNFVKTKLNKAESKKNDDASSSSSAAVTTDLQEIKAAAGSLVHEAREAVTQIDPWVSELFKAKLQELPVPNYFFQDASHINSTEDIYRLLRRKQQHVELFDFAYEQLLLGEAGTFMLQPKAHMPAYPVTFPPCNKGDACCGKVINIPDMENVGPFVLSQVMYRDEYETLLFTEGAAPPPPRACILCCRRLLVDWVTWNRTITMTSEVQTGTSTASRAHRFSETAPVYQLFRNLVNEPNGYFGQYVLTPQEGDAIVDPICMFIVPLLKRVKWELSPGCHRRYIDQSLMQWRPTSSAVPKIGESIQNFCSGVSGPQQARLESPAMSNGGTKRPKWCARPPLHQSSTYSAHPAVSATTSKS
jgi:hypothetical protein